MTKGGVALLGVAGVLVLAQQGGGEPTPPVTAAVVAPPKVAVYEVEGTVASVDVTMATPSGTKQFSADVPMRPADLPGLDGLRATVVAGQFLYLSAQQDIGGTTTTCRITVDGVVLAENTSTGRYSIVTCSGVVPT